MNLVLVEFVALASRRTALDVFCQSFSLDHMRDAFYVVIKRAELDVFSEFPIKNNIREHSKCLLLFWEIMKIVWLAIAERDYLTDKEFHFASCFLVDIGRVVDRILSGEMGFFAFSVWRP